MVQTLEQRVQNAANLIYEVGNHHGTPISRELAYDIAVALQWVAQELRTVGMKPGDIARYCRDRYDEETDSKQEK